MAADAGSERGFASRSAAETEALGAALGAALVAGDVVALEGELASGKTTLVRGLARGLGVAEAPTSPSFVLMQEHEGRVPFFHFDAWMAGREALFLEGGGAEYLGGEGVAAVEWAERVAAWLPRPHLRVRLVHRGPSERELRVRVEPAPEPVPAGARERQERLAALVARLREPGP